MDAIEPSTRQGHSRRADRPLSTPPIWTDRPAARPTDRPHQSVAPGLDLTTPFGLNGHVIAYGPGSAHRLLLHVGTYSLPQTVTAVRQTERA